MVGEHDADVRINRMTERGAHHLRDPKHAGGESTHGTRSSFRERGTLTASIEGDKTRMPKWSPMSCTRRVDSPGISSWRGAVNESRVFDRYRADGSHPWRSNRRRLCASRPAPVSLMCHDRAPSARPRCHRAHTRPISVYFCVVPAGALLAVSTHGDKSVLAPYSPFLFRADDARCCAVVAPGDGIR